MSNQDHAGEESNLEVIYEVVGALGEVVVKELPKRFELSEHDVAVMYETLMFLYNEPENAEVDEWNDNPFANEISLDTLCKRVLPLLTGEKYYTLSTLECVCICAAMNFVNDMRFKEREGYQGMLMYSEEERDEVIEKVVQKMKNTGLQ